MGAKNNTFGVPGVEQHALFLKELDDARAIRKHLLENFERATIPVLTKHERSKYVN